MKFFRKGEASDYNGGRTAKDIVEFCAKKAGPAISILADKAAVDGFKTKSDVVAVYFGDASSEAGAAFTKFAESRDDVLFAICADASAGEAKANSVVLFKNFDEGRNDLENVTAESLAEFVQANSTPLVMTFDDKAIEKIFHKNSAAILLFNDAAKDGSAAAGEAFAAASKSLKGKIIFSETKASDPTGNYKKLGDYVGADLSKVSITLLQPGQEMLKYKFE